MIRAVTRDDLPMLKFEAAFRTAVAESERTVCINLLRENPGLTIGDLARASGPVAELLAKITIEDLTASRRPDRAQTRRAPDRKPAAKKHAAEKPAAKSLDVPLIENLTGALFDRTKLAACKPPQKWAAHADEVPAVLDALERWAREDRGPLHGRRQDLYKKLTGACPDTHFTLPGFMATLGILSDTGLVTPASHASRTWHVHLDLIRRDPRRWAPQVGEPDTRRALWSLMDSVQPMQPMQPMPPMRERWAPQAGDSDIPQIITLGTAPSSPTSTDARREHSR